MVLVYVMDDLVDIFDDEWWIFKVEKLVKKVFEFKREKLCVKLGFINYKFNYVFFFFVFDLCCGIDDVFKFFC